ncbi:hypothetical protein M0805_003602 [Coniferiporia weirii]|nr:hypothetical protein M0805_003602 [Coniferiporia weirii]
MEVLGIVYLIENAQQFWTELEDIIYIPPDASLAQLDATLARFISFCATYHEQYLQTPVQLEHACSLLLQGELFTFHSERMREQLLDDAEKTTDPHTQLIIYQVLLQYGRNHQSFLRSHKKWLPLLPLLMDHVSLDFDPEVEDYVTSANWTKVLSAPIEANLRLLAVGILYEVSRVQKFSVSDLRLFDDDFIDHLFDLVEQTRHMQDESLNYSLIRLIVALNEQFMVASLSASSPTPGATHHDKKHSRPEDTNRVLRVLMRRLNSSKTFGENMIFMLNRAGRSPEDLCMQLLILKILYLLFTTKGTTEYFYTNDLCVLVDVFLRELVDLDEESDSLRHTYLRVLHPLLTRTQLRSVPYKRPQIVRTLESLVGHPNIRDINATTKRLVERCLSGDWCVQLRKVESPCSDSSTPSFGFARVGSPSSPGGDSIASASKSEYVAPPIEARASKQRDRSQTIKTSRSFENLRPAYNAKHRSHSGGSALGRGKQGNASTLNLTDIGASLPSASSMPNSPQTSSLKTPPAKAQRAPALVDQNPASSSTSSLPSSISSLDQLAGATTPTNASGKRSSISRTHTHVYAHSHMSTHSEPGGVSISPNTHTNSLGQVVDSIVAPTPLVATPVPPAKKTAPPLQHHRAAPPAPPRRRKPPAIPAGPGTMRTTGGATMTTIASSRPSPLSRAHPIVPS